MPRKPYKFTEKRKTEFLRLLSEGYRRSKAAEAVGVHRTRISQVMVEDPAFASQVEEAELSCCELVEDSLFQRAVGGDVRACMLWLRSRSPSRWGRTPQPVEQDDSAAPLKLYCSECNKRLAGQHPDREQTACLHTIG